MADRETLIRRVTLDLTGLPPTLEEIDGFLEDDEGGAYERVVDRLMGTTSYAERRAQDWLDLARYADTRGFADDKMRNIWPWRDWVVRALDQNQPFDQFTIEQLAGDMLPEATDEQRLATAFHRNAPQARGQTYPVEEYRIKGVIDRVNTIGRVWLGLTLDCAECHDHKFDPITQYDYYSLLSIFNNIEHSGSGHGQGGPTMKYRPPPPKLNASKAAKYKQFKEALAAARKALPKPPRLKTYTLLVNGKGHLWRTIRKNIHLRATLPSVRGSVQRKRWPIWYQSTTGEPSNAVTSLALEGKGTRAASQVICSSGHLQGRNPSMGLPFTEACRLMTAKSTW